VDHSESLKKAVAARKAEKVRRAEKAERRKITREIRAKEQARKAAVKARSAPPKSVAARRADEVANDEVVRRAAAELLRLAEAKDSLAKYREELEPTGHLDFKFPHEKHHRVMAEAFERMESSSPDDYKARHILIMLPPGSAKSTIASVQFATWYLARHPDYNILACSNTTDLAENFNRRRRGICLSDEWQRLSETSLKEDARGVGRFQTTRDGSITAAGVGSAIAGLRCQLLLLDDPVQSLEQAMSQTQLDKIWNWFESDARTRLIPGGCEVVIMTRWARNDPAGHILDLIKQGREEWTVIRIPMLCDDPEHDLLGRAEGERLWPEWFTQKQIEQNIRNPLRWSSLYQQVPLSDSGSWVDDEHIRYVDEVPDNLNIIIAGDIALTVGRGDFTVWVVAGLDEARNIFILDVVRERESADNSVWRLFALNEQYKPSAIVMDDDNATKVFTRLLYELARTRHVSIPLETMPLRGQNKEVRAAPMRGWFMQERVFIKRSTWNLDLHSEIIEFPHGDHDDQVDCLSLIGRRIAEMRPPRAKAGEILKKGIICSENGKYMLNTTLKTLFADADSHRPRRDRLN